MPVCICDLLAPIAIRTPILVLVHRTEAFKTSNTGRLAQLMLGARVERWGVQGASRPELPDGPLLLLFPSDDARELTAEDGERGATLIVPDGNWPQARKIAKRVGLIAEGRVTHVRLGQERATGYTLRKTQRPEAVSTLESIAHALRILEGERGADVATKTLAFFDAFVARHAPFSRGLDLNPRAPDPERPLGLFVPTRAGKDALRERDRVHWRMIEGAPADGHEVPALLRRLVGSEVAPRRAAYTALRELLTPGGEQSALSAPAVPFLAAMLADPEVVSRGRIAALLVLCAASDRDDSFARASRVALTESAEWIARADATGPELVVRATALLAARAPAAPLVLLLEAWSNASDTAP